MKKIKQRQRRPHTEKRAGIEIPGIFRISQPATAVLLALIAFFAYANSLEGRFVFDDTVIIQDNESIQGLDAAHLKQIFGQHYWKVVENKGGLYRPLIMLSYAINYATSGYDPVGYHVLNILLHALNGILVFFILEALFSHRVLSVLTALLFILHPIHTEGVASIVGRAESLSAGFVLAAWLLYIKHHKSGRYLWLWLSSFSYVLAIFSKENAYAFVALLPLTDYVLANGKLHQLSPNRAMFLRYVPYGLAIAVTFLLRFWVLGGLAPLYINPRSNPLAQAALWPRFLTATNVFGRYLVLLIWPMNLSADYSYNQIPLLTSILSPAALMPLFLLLLFAAGLVLSVRRYPVLFFSGVVFLSSFILTSNWIQPIGTIMGERLMYFPALGFNSAVGFLLCKGFIIPKWRTLSYVLAGILLVGYGFRTFDRNKDWRDHYSLFSSAVRTSPESSLVQSNYATVILSEKNDLSGAALHARKALQIMPQDPAAHFTLGQAYHRLGNLPAAVDAFQAVVRLAPRTSGGADALREEAEIEEAQGNYGQARASYETLREWQPANVAAHLALARVYFRLGESAHAREALARCLELAPDDPAVQQALKAYGTGR